MRAGALSHRGRIVGGKSYWMGLIEKPSAEPPMQAGLRLPTMVEIRARYGVPLTADCHVYIGNRLFYITSVRDPNGSRIDLVASAEELSGQPAVYQSKIPGSQPVNTRCHIRQDIYTANPSTNGNYYRYRLEVPLIECPAPQPKDGFTTADGTRYQVFKPIEGADDGVVRAVWADQIQ